MTKEKVGNQSTNLSKPSLRETAHPASIPALFRLIQQSNDHSKKMVPQESAHLTKHQPYQLGLSSPSREEENEEEEEEDSVCQETTFWGVPC